MNNFSFHLPSRISYYLLVLAEILEVGCRIFLSYFAVVVILFLPFSISLLQRGSDLIQSPQISWATRNGYTKDALAIIINYKVYTTTYNEDEVNHLIAVRQVFFTIVIASIAITVLLAFLVLNRRHFQVLRHTVLLKWSLGVMALFALGTITFFPVCFATFHRLVFPLGNYVFPPNSPLLLAFPATFWWLAYICLQVGAVISMSLQAIYVQRQEV